MKNRVNVIRQKIEESVLTQWYPVLVKAGVRPEMVNVLSQYCHIHSIYESSQQVLAPIRSVTTLIDSIVKQPTIQPTTLPLVIKILSNTDLLKRIRIETVSTPMFQVLIGDQLIVDEVDSISIDFHIPSVDSYMAGTNIIDIYEDRIIEKCKESIEKYIVESNADTIVLYLFNLHVVTNVDPLSLNTSTQFQMILRIKTFNDAVYDPRSNKETESVDNNITGYSGYSDSNQNNYSGHSGYSGYSNLGWLLMLDKKPSKFKMWLAKIFFGTKFKQKI